MATVMLAKKYKETSFMEYSQVWAEPKFDGVRCFWNGKHLFSRTGKRILNFPHIEVSCDLATNGSFALDGELVPPPEPEPAPTPEPTPPPAAEPTPPPEPEPTPAPESGGE